MADIKQILVIIKDINGDIINSDNKYVSMSYLSKKDTDHNLHKLRKLFKNRDIIKYVLNTVDEKKY